MPRHEHLRGKLRSFLASWDVCRGTAPASPSPAPPAALPSELQGKRVVVVGAGKTAHDVGVAVSEVATSATLVARRGAWMAPQKVLGEWPAAGWPLQAG